MFVKLLKHGQRVWAGNDKCKDSIEMTKGSVVFMVQD